MWRWSAIILAPFAYLATREMTSRYLVGTSVADVIGNNLAPLAVAFIVVAIVVVAGLR